MEFKILVLVVASDTYPSKRNKKIIEKTWAKDTSTDTKVLFYKSGDMTRFVKENEIILEVGKSTLDMSKKNILAFQFALENYDFDYIFRTTTASYVNLNLLRKYIDDNFTEEKNLYSGIILETNDHSGNNIKFINGAGIIFSRDVIKKIVKNREKLDFNLWDDVGIGKLLNQLKIIPKEGERFDIKGNIFSQNISKRHYHYRCRIDNHYGYPRFLEFYVIKYLHKLINNKSTNKIFIKMWSTIFEIFKLFYIQYPFLKILLLFKKIIKFLMPNFLYTPLKKSFEKTYKKIMLRYFKY